jgi:hypothetical protein
MFIMETFSKCEKFSRKTEVASRKPLWDSCASSAVSVSVPWSGLWDVQDGTYVPFPFHSPCHMTLVMSFELFYAFEYPYMVFHGEILDSSLSSSMVTHFITFLCRTPKKTLKYRFFVCILGFL